MFNPKSLKSLLKTIVTQMCENYFINTEQKLSSINAICAGTSCEIFKRIIEGSGTYGNTIEEIIALKNNEKLYQQFVNLLVQNIDNYTNISVLNRLNWLILALDTFPQNSQLRDKRNYYEKMQANIENSTATPKHNIINKQKYVIMTVP